MYIYIIVSTKAFYTYLSLHLKKLLKACMHEEVMDFSYEELTFYWENYYFFTLYKRVSVYLVTLSVSATQTSMVVFPTPLYRQTEFLLFGIVVHTCKRLLVLYRHNIWTYHFRKPTLICHVIFLESLGGVLHIGGNNVKVWFPNLLVYHNENKTVWPWYGMFLVICRMAFVRWGVIFPAQIRFLYYKVKVEVTINPIVN